MNQEILRVYEFGIENIDTLKTMDRNREKKRFAKVMIMYIVLALFNNHKKQAKELLIVGSKNAYISHGIDNSSIVYTSRMLDCASKIFFGNTLMTPISYFERLKIIKEIIIGYIKYGSYIKYPSTWIDFCWIDGFVRTSNANKITSYCHYDEVGTWLSWLSRVYNYKYEIKQHGLVSESVKIKRKLHVDYLDAFDNNSIKVFKKMYILNNDCHCYISRRKSSVQFEYIKKITSYLYVGLIEQDNQLWIDGKIQLLKKLGIKSKIYIMRHPLSHAIYRYDDKNIVVTDKKIRNIDVIIMDYSTLALDYYMDDNPAPVIFTNSIGCKQLMDYPFLYAKDDYNLKNIVLEIVNNDKE